MKSKQGKFTKMRYYKERERERERERELLYINELNGDFEKKKEA
jgi:hypothetical protein